MKMIKEKGIALDFSKLQSCSENQKCPENRLCCQSPCGMKCMRAVTEENAEEVLNLIQKDVEVQESLEPYEETEDDKKFGMCPENYLRTHPEFKEKMHNKFLKKHKQHQHDGQCNGTDCSEKHKEKYQKHFHKFSAKADCSVDGDCSDQMRCCRTICGKKCMKPVFTEEDYKKSMFGDKYENKQKRDLETQEEKPGSPPGEELDHDHSKCKHGKCHKKRQGHNRDNEEESEEGDEHGRGHGKGSEHGKGPKHGKGCNKGKEHGKGKGKGLQEGKGRKHGKCHGKGRKHGKGHGKGLENDDDDSESHENKGEVEEGAETVREKRLAKFGSDEQNNGNEHRPTNAEGKGNCKGKKKGKGKKNKRGKGKGRGRGEGKGKKEDEE
ncbi:uncharacterized protein [Aquarana catesbeiana]